MKNKSILFLKKLTYLTSYLTLTYLFILMFPGFIFAYSVTYKQVSVYSDRKIDKNIYAVVEDALTRIKRSELYNNEIHFDIYICNDLWRLGFFTQGNTLAGGIAQYNFTRDIFIRTSNIRENKIIPPDEWYSANKPFSFQDRPLSYYFAHEMTHILQSRYTGRGSWRYPAWLTEGYADYIGKGGNFDFDQNLHLWHKDAPELDPSKGLYRLYHLKISYLLDKQKKSIKDLYKRIPNDDVLTRKIWSLKPNQ